MRIILIAVVICIFSGLFFYLRISARRSQVTPDRSSQSYLPSPSLEAVPLPTAPPSWPVYTSKEHGYSLRYPPQWFIIEPEQDRTGSHVVISSVELPISLGDELGHQVVLNLHPAGKVNSAMRWLNATNPGLSDVAPNRVRARDIRVNDVQAVEVSGLPSFMGALEIVLVKNHTVFHFFLQPYQSGELPRESPQDPAVDTFHQIVGSIRFH